MCNVWHNLQCIAMFGTIFSALQCFLELSCKFCHNSRKPVITMQLQNGDDDHLYDVDGDADHVYNVDGGHLGDPDGHISR